MPFEFVRVPGGPHGFDGRMNKPEMAAYFEQAFEFLKKNLSATRMR